MHRRSMNQILPYLLCSALYAAVAAALVRALTGPSRNPLAQPKTLHALIAVPLALHTILLYRSVFNAESMYFGVGDSISVIIWLTVLIYWLGGFFYRLEGLQVFIAAAAAMLVWAPLALPSVRPLSHTDAPVFRLHILIALLAYSLFTIASLQALMMAVLERRLHGGKLPAFLESLPPLLTMERMLFKIITLGFVLLTLTLASGMLFSEELSGKPFKVNHKFVFAIVSWCIFAALLAGRRIYGWRGRVALRWTLGGFVVLVLAYIGSKFVLEIILHR
jgi:ABC-type uncharacterized transport system permease subunit